KASMARSWLPQKVRSRQRSAHSIYWQRGNFACSCCHDGDTTDPGAWGTSNGFSFHELQSPAFFYIGISLFSYMQHKRSISLTDAQIEEAARLFATLSEPSRLRLLQALMRGPMTVTELVEATGMKQGNVSKQLGILYDAHLLARNRHGNFIRYAV